ncbi:MAG: FliM/FliN family flagellar motor switch protein [Candidatus Handelsmanbacteria bacterium]|nr:FliM/FliN family flagellar motor switch protein [Candidatus Handelsmanbacteria bacterium]
MSEKRNIGNEIPAGPAPLVGLGEVEVRITLELGRTELTLEEATSLAEHSTVVGDKMADEPVDLLINGKLLGRGKLVLVGEHYGVQLTELIDQGGEAPPPKRLRKK